MARQDCRDGDPGQPGEHHAVTPSHTANSSNPHKPPPHTAGSFLGDFRTPSGVRNSSRKRNGSFGGRIGSSGRSLTRSLVTDSGPKQPPLSNAHADLLAELLHRVSPPAVIAPRIATSHSALFLPLRHDYGVQPPDHFALIGTRSELCLSSGPGGATRCRQWRMHTGGLRQACRNLEPSQHVSKRHSGPEPPRQHLFAQHCAQCRSNSAQHLADLDHRLRIHDQTAGRSTAPRWPRGSVPRAKSHRAPRRRDPIPAALHETFALPAPRRSAGSVPRPSDRRR